MELIALYAPYTADFTTLGLGALTPSECTVTWQAAGASLPASRVQLLAPAQGPVTGRSSRVAHSCSGLLPRKSKGTLSTPSR